MIVFELIPFTLSPAAVDKHQPHVGKPAKVRGRPNHVQYGPSLVTPTMNLENRSLVTDEPVEFEKQPVEGQGFRKIAHDQKKKENCP